MNESNSELAEQCDEAAEPTVASPASAMQSLSGSITFRPATEVDMDFLRRVYASTRAEEMAMVPWTEEQKAGFCRMQFEAQHAHYHTHYPNSAYDILQQDGRDIGRLYVDRTEAEILVLDITLLPEYRGGGRGAGLLRDLQEEARATGKVLTIYVEKFNPARRLYDRLGFQEKEDVGVYQLMKWSGN